MPPLCEIYLPHPAYELKTSSVILSAKPVPQADPSSQQKELVAGTIVPLRGVLPLLLYLPDMI